MSTLIKKIAISTLSLIVVGLLMSSSSQYARSHTAGITYDNATSSWSTSASTQLSFSHTVTSAGVNRMLLVGVGGNVAPSSVYYGSQEMTLVDSSYETYNNEYVYLYYLKNPEAGQNSVAINSGTSTYYSSTAVSYTGVFQERPEVVVTGNNSTPVQPYTQSLDTLTDGSWVAMMVVYPGTSGFVMEPASGSTLRGEELATSGMFVDSNGPITPKGTTSLSVNPTSTPNSYATRYGSVMVAFKPASPLKYSAHKAVNTSVSSRTETHPDGKLALVLETGKTYAIDGAIFVTSTNATPNFKFDIAATSASAVVIGYAATDGSTGQNQALSGGMLTISRGTKTVTVAANAPMPIHLFGTVTMSARGELVLEWGQGTSSVYAVTVMKGSYLRAEEIE